MFVIRTAQLEALGKAREATFERQAAERLKKKYPDKCKALGDDGVRQWVSKAMQKRLHGTWSQWPRVESLKQLRLFQRLK